MGSCFDRVSRVVMSTSVAWRSASHPQSGPYLCRGHGRKAGPPDHGPFQRGSLKVVNVIAGSSIASASRSALCRSDAPTLRRLPAPQRYLLNRPFRRVSTVAETQVSLVRMQRRSNPKGKAIGSNWRSIREFVSPLRTASGIGTSPPYFFAQSIDLSRSHQTDYKSIRHPIFPSPLLWSVQKQATSVQVPIRYTRINMGTWSIGHP